MAAEETRAAEKRLWVIGQLQALAETPAAKTARLPEGFDLGAIQKNTVEIILKKFEESGASQKLIGVVADIIMAIPLYRTDLETNITSIILRVNEHITRFNSPAIRRGAARISDMLKTYLEGEIHKINTTEYLAPAGLPLKIKEDLENYYTLLVINRLAQAPSRGGARRTRRRTRRR